MRGAGETLYMQNGSGKNRNTTSQRKSGILLHITSLQSRFGIGDIGPAAFKFVDFLKRSGQKIWQVLPVGPTSPAYGNSPYSCISAFAGNPLLISPELMSRRGMVTSDELNGTDFSHDRVDYPSVIRYKTRLLQTAFTRFWDSRTDWEEFQAFCNKNAYWLEDFALFETLRHSVFKKQWNFWPADIRDRRQEALQELQKSYIQQILFVKFVQYIFFDQWQSLKIHCNRAGIEIMGDVPLYVNYDSVDVWSHQNLFILGEDYLPEIVSGVPPDYYSETGQLWNNPVYKWETHKRANYSWWIDRTSHNLELFDRLRLDHFRGFIAYWGVPAGNKTARTGRWYPGPGSDLFIHLKNRFPEMRFVAEDLGDITDEVYETRDRFGIPGMRVFQFGFGPGASEYHRPHNYTVHCVAYTGTHDNDTVQGWLKALEADKHASLEEVKRYIGQSGSSLRSAHWKCIRVLMMSCAEIVIFPLQDVLGTGSEGRMNIPATPRGNWEWRIPPGKPGKRHSVILAEMSSLYGRSS